MALAVMGFVAVTTGCSGSSPTPPPLAASGAVTISPSPVSASTGSSPSPEASVAASPSASASPRTSDRRSADKVLTDFLTGLRAAASAKSSAALKPLYTPSCLWCADQTKSIDLAAFLNGSRTGGAVTDISVRYRGVGKAKQLVFDVTMSVSAMKVVDANGHKQLSSPAVAHSAFTFGVAESGGRWTIVDGSQGREAL
jgi:hypothetical protein